MSCIHAKGKNKFCRKTSITLPELQVRIGAGKLYCLYIAVTAQTMWVRGIILK